MEQPEAGAKTPVHLSPQDNTQLWEGLGRFSLRSAASYVMGPYDPLGLASPLSLRAKLLLRRSHVALEFWDQELPKDIKREWGGLIGELQ